MKKISLILAMLMLIIYPAQTVLGFTYESEDSIYSESIQMIDIETGVVVYSYNADEERSIASLTKIMTYIVAYENIPNIETTEVTVTEQASEILASTNSSLAGISVGETYTVLQLLNLMMIPSGNDAALVLALYYDSINGFDNDYVGYDEDGVDLRSSDMGESPFIKLMNEKAIELGCENTNFTNPHGLYNDEHYSTASDMAVITLYATTVPYFTEITGKSLYEYSAVGSDTVKTVYSTNKLFSSYLDDGKYYYQYATGIKTGSLKQSGYCIAASAQKDDSAYIVIALGAEYVDEDGNYVSENGAMLDAKTLFKWAFSSLEKTTIVLKDDLLGSISIEYAWDMEYLQLVSQENLEVIVPTGVSKSSVNIVLDIPDYIEAPVTKGDVIGTASIYYDGDEIGQVNVVASESVAKSQIVRTIEFGKDIVNSTWFIGIVSFIIVLTILYIACAIAYNRNRNKIKKRKEYKIRKK